MKTWVLVSFHLLVLLLGSACSTSQMYLMKGTQADNRGEPAIAVTNYEMAVKALTSWDKNLGEEDTLNGFIYLSMARDKYRLGDYKDAAADYDEHFRLNPLLKYCLFKSVPVSIHFESAAAKQRAGDFNAAIAELNEAVALQPKNPETYYRRAAVEWRIKDFTTAEADYEAGLATNKINFQAYYLRAEFKFDSGDIDGALSDLDQSAKLDAKNIQAYFLRGSINLCASNYPAAMTNFTRCIELNPQYVRPYACRAGAEQDLKDYENAIADYDRALKARHSTAEEGDFEKIYSSRAYCYERTLDYEKELADRVECSKLQPTNGLARALEAGSLIRLGRLEEAGTNLEKAIKLSPVDRVYETAGWNYADMAKYTNALSCFTTALQLNPTNAYACNGLGYLHENLSQWQMALESFQKADELWPGYPYIWYHSYRVRAVTTGTEAAQRELATRLQNIPATQTNEWQFEIGTYLIGKATESELFTAATNSTPNRFVQQEQLCEACYYAGIQHLLAGQKNEAKNLFEECIQTGEKDFIEYRGAQAELRSLRN